VNAVVRKKAADEAKKDDESMEKTQEEAWSVSAVWMGLSCAACESAQDHKKQPDS